ncbi:hypothetical protein [Paenibacillus sp.]|uniref:hypothetical protein n=1 Tax=Paenibacillus sp. TaxID=58172 RepID=UPI002D502E75|nr:hypothetical protein [Paenibacillus sp.]HZG85355.1 hypothetical protein [Paenibacillus sp.]
MRSVCEICGGAEEISPELAGTEAEAAFERLIVCAGCMRDRHGDEAAGGASEG